MHVKKIEGLAGQALIALFHQARHEDYAAIDEDVTRLAQVVRHETSGQERLACTCLIRRYVNPQASIRYGTAPAPDQVVFDTPDAGLSHRGALGAFEVMPRARPRRSRAAGRSRDRPRDRPAGWGARPP